jgi:hypothetical protein
MNELPEIAKMALPSLIGVISALLVVFIKGLIVDARVQRSRERREILNRRLTELYTPLWTGIAGKEDTIKYIIEDEQLRSLVKKNFHLLSPTLQEILEQFISIGKDNRLGLYTAAELRAILDLTPKFKEVLRKEFRHLSEEFNKELKL